MIELRDIRKAYKTESFTQMALDGVSLAFRDNEFVAVLGPSGSGKTTLLNILGGLDHADSGDIVINGVSTRKYKSADWDTYRNHRIGFIFQSYNLIPHQSVRSNVELALTLSGVSRQERTKRATEALQRVGLGDHVNKKPAQLSGGQMQRVAIARALINDPDIVLADEPTGALDTETGLQVMDLLSEIAQDRLVIMVTHNPDLAEQYANRIVSLTDGRITGDTNPLTPQEMRETLQAVRPLVKDKANGHAKRVKAAEVPSSAVAAVAPASADDASGAVPADSSQPDAEAALGDDAPVHDEASVAAERARDAAKGSKKHASMSFFTALALSFNNLMTKKGRTFLTAFAGSIGIIGIAAILALSNGVNNYIAKTEEEALTSFPLTITKSSFDIAGLMTAGMTIGDDGESGENDALNISVSEGSEREEGDQASPSDKIGQINIMTDMFAEVKNNDLVAFKEYLDSDESGIDEYVNLIQYSYSVVPQVYSTDVDDGIVRLNPSSMSTMLSSGFATSAFSFGSNGTSSFQEMIDNQDMLNQQYEVVLGQWPQAYDEAVLVLGGDGQITDYTLYSLGVYDPKVMEEMTRQALEGEEVVVPDDHVDFTYEDALGMTFSVVPTSSMYQKNEEQNTWTDMSNDKEFMQQAIEEGVQLHIVGVVQPTVDNAIMPEGVAYTSGLTRYLMQAAADSQIVQEQMADRDVDVFTGKTFVELKDEEGEGFDMESMFDIDEEALQNAFGFDTSALSSLGSDMSLDPNALSMDPSSSSIDPNALQVDPSVMEQIFSEENMAAIMAGAPPFTFDAASMGYDTGGATVPVDPAQGAGDADQAAAAANEAMADAAASTQGGGEAPDASADGVDGQGDGDSAGSESAPTPTAAPTENPDPASIPATAPAGGLTDEQMQAINDASNQLAAGFVAWAGPERLADPNADVAALFQDYLATDPTAQQIVAGMNETLGDSAQEMVNQAMQTYMTQQFAPYMANAMQTLMNQAAQAMAIQIAEGMTTQIAAMTESFGTTLANAISGELSSSMDQLANAMQNGFTFDAEAFASAIHFNMTQEDLTSLLMNYMNADDLSYDGNLSKLGYGTLDDPETVSIYPKDFEAKESVLDIIDAYNESVTVGDDDSKAINYTDLAGVLMSSVNDIVNMISLVLIAFVSISLVVSSIMIGIITYISVLERKKEIGILRAIGASKGNIANVFNAETVIEGLIAGLFAIAVVQLVSIPVNAIVLATHDVDHVMSLPWSSAGILVLISVLLTFIAGLIPSTAASRRDPVEALRSE